MLDYTFWWIWVELIYLSLFILYFDFHDMCLWNFFRYEHICLLLVIGFCWFISVCAFASACALGGSLVFLFLVYNLPVICFIWVELEGFICSFCIRYWSTHWLNWFQVILTYTMEGTIIRRVIPSDNSCLFNAVG